MSETSRANAQAHAEAVEAANRANAEAQRQRDAERVKVNAKGRCKHARAALEEIIQIGAGDEQITALTTAAIAALSAVESVLP